MIIEGFFEHRIEDYAIDINDFMHSCDKSFDFLYKRSTKISGCHYPILSKFFNKEGNDIVPDYFTDCQYNEVANNYRMRFVILGDNTDFYLIPLRIVDPINKSVAQRHFIVSHEILSLNGGDTTKAYIAIEPYVEYAVVASSVYGTELVNSVFFNVRTEAFYERSKWKSKNGVNLLTDKITIKKSNSLNNKELNDVIDLNHKWTALKNKKTPDSLIKGFNANATGHFILYYFNNTLIGFQFVTIGYKNIATCHISKSVCDVDEQIARHIGAYMIYCLHKFCFGNIGSSVVNYLGVRDVKKYAGLYNFKEKYFKHKTNYYKTPIKAILRHSGAL